MALQLDITKSSVYQEGVEEGIAKGRDETLLEIIREMHADGDSIAKIARICHLTEDRVKEILNI
jgi:predicted transposase/invertase (TIGR01784 family)